MSVTIRIPTPLRAYTDGASVVDVPGDTVGAALLALTQSHPNLSQHLRDETVRLRSFVNVYLGEEDIRFLENLDTQLADGAELQIVPAIAGGK